uniref:Uncharacterized protein n=1 Tax=uncultured Caudovirales phage TaxID=2100421 RepID=A0A6J5L1C7_9CAUD|nr:hypothetical protein UFOVP114_49 [uncultured Caudovirales phage]
MTDTMDLRQVGKPRAPKDKAPDLIGSELEIQLTYPAPDGQTHKGALVSRIMSPAERQAFARGCAVEAQGPWEFMPPEQQRRIRALVCVAIQIREPPEWFAKWAVVDDYLLFAIWEQCVEHEARYLRRIDSEGNPRPGRPGLVVRSALSAPDPKPTGGAA